MKFLLSPDSEGVFESTKEHHMLCYTEFFDCHFSQLEEVIREFIEQCKTSYDNGLYITNNYFALDIIDNLVPDSILWIEKLNPEDKESEYMIKPFWEVFSNLRHLRQSYVISDIIKMFMYGVIQRDLTAIEKGEIVYKFT